MLAKIRGDKMLLAWILLFILALIWGSSFILIKKGLMVYSPAEVGGIRILAGSIVMGLLSIKYIKELKLRQFKILFASGLLGSFFPAFLFAMAQTKLDSSVTGALNALTPLFVLTLGALVFGQKIPSKSIIGISIGFGGTLLLIFAGSGKLSEGFNLDALNWSVFLVVLATFCYGMNVNIIKYKLPGIKPLAIAGISLSFLIPISGIFLFFFTPFTSTLAHTPGANLALAYLILLGVFGTGIALIFFNKLVQLTNPVFTSTVTYLIPIVALFWGVLDGEILKPGNILGMSAIVLGVYLANRRKV
jgi:drug/metabolite transporter (DMT)-like permease